MAANGRTSRCRKKPWASPAQSAARTRSSCLTVLIRRRIPLGPLFAPTAATNLAERSLKRRRAECSPRCAGSQSSPPVDRQIDIGGHSEQVGLAGPAVAAAETRDRRRDAVNRKRSVDEVTFSASRDAQDTFEFRHLGQAVDMPVARLLAAKMPPHPRGDPTRAIGAPGIKVGSRGKRGRRKPPRRRGDLRGQPQ